MKLLPVLDAPSLLNHCKLDPDLREIEGLSGLDRRVFHVLMKEPIYRYAEAVQLSPASENHHHSGPGGLLIHTLDVITIALKKRKAYQLPLGGSISELSEQRHIWTFGVFAGCLLHDIGKLSANTRLRLHFQDGETKLWSPHDEPLATIQDIKGYTIEFSKTTPYEYHQRLALSHFDILPRVARKWIAQAPNMMAQLLAYLWGDRFESGVIGEIAEFADRESTARNLQVPVEHRFSSSIPPVERYLRLIRNWLSDGLIRVNVSGAMGWVDKEGHVYLVCRSLAEKLIVECNGMGLKNLPQDPVRIYDILQEHGYALPTNEGKAIWTIKVTGDGFDHQLTCLKFEARRLTLPTKPLAPFAGELRPLSPAEAAEIAVKSEEVIDGAAEVAASETTDSESAGETVANVEADKALPATAHTRQEEVQEEMELEGSSENVEERTHEPAKNNGTAQNNIEHEETGKATQATAKDGLPDNAAPMFFAWLKKNIIEKTLLINDAGAEVHIVPEGVFLVAPAIFKTWLSRQGLDGDKLHKTLSKRFARLRKHIRNNGMNIHPYWVSSSNRASKINGWVLPFDAIFEHDYPIPKPNKYIRKSLGGD